MSKNSKLLVALQEVEAKYGSITNAPKSVQKEIAQLRPSDSDEDRHHMEPDELYAMMYMVRHGGFGIMSMSLNVHHSKQWVKDRLPIIEEKLKENDHGSKH